MKFLSEIEQKQTRKVIPRVSKTIPNSALTPKEILENYSRPSFDELAQLGYYDEEANFDSVTTDDFEDLTDLMQFSANSKRINEIYLAAQERAKKNPKKPQIKHEDTTVPSEEKE